MKTTKKKVTVTLIESPKDDNYPDEHEFVSKRHEETGGGYSDDNVAITVKANGALCFTDDILEGEFIYLYPEQVKHLESVLRKRKAMLKGKKSGHKRL